VDSIIIQIELIVINAKVQNQCNINNDNDKLAITMANARDKVTLLLVRKRNNEFL
jgi:hypothetical protein